MVTKGLLFQLLLHQGADKVATRFPGLLHFTLDPHLKILSAKRGRIKLSSIVYPPRSKFRFSLLLAVVK